MNAAKHVTLHPKTTVNGHTPPTERSFGRLILYHAIAFLVMTTWGATFASTKTLILQGMGETNIFFLRFLGAYALLVLTSHKKWRADSLRDEALLMLAGLTGGSLYFVAENYGLHFAQTTDVSFIIAFTPLLTTLFAYMLRIERATITHRFVTGLAIALVGIGCLIFKGQFTWQASFLGDGLALLAAILWALYSLIIKPLGKHYDVVFITRKIFFYGLVTILPVLFIRPIADELPLLQRPVVWGNLLFLTVIASYLCFILWNKVLEVLGPLKSSYYLYINPVSASIVSVLFMDEEKNLYILGGLLLILLGVIYSEHKG